MYKILIVEDDELISKKLESFLKSWNYDVNRVVDFYNVLDAFQSFNPDLVLMDITLPYLNGYLFLTFTADFFGHFRFLFVPLVQAVYHVFSNVVLSVGYQDIVSRLADDIIEFL